MSTLLSLDTSVSWGNSPNPYSLGNSPNPTSWVSYQKTTSPRGFVPDSFPQLLGCLASRGVSVLVGTDVDAASARPRLAVDVDVLAPGFRTGYGGIDAQR